MTTRDQNQTFWFGLGCVIAGLATCIIVLLVGIIFFNWVLQEPKDTRVSLQIPATIGQNDTFRLAIQIENLGARPKVLDSIELSPDYLAGITVEESAPPFITTVDRPYSGDQAYTFDLVLEPSEIVTIEFSAVGQQAGEFSGELDVCVDGMVRCLSYGIQTVVEP